MRKHTTEQFILAATIKHNNKYTYESTVYVDAKTPVIITCPFHGDFNQTPDSHIGKSSGCIKCAGLEKLTKEAFISKSVAQHGDKYDYSLVNYKNNMSKVDIICRDHGVFSQIPAAHMDGRGCSICGGTSKNTRDTYIAKAKLVHGDTYSYENVVYTLIDNKISITCKEHGDFYQVASSHLNGRGCPICAGKNKTTESFIAEAKMLHGDVYDYIGTVYRAAKERVLICCRKHGEFLQTPDAHLRGSGCRKCAMQSKITTADFIKSAELVHGDRYDYSLVEYVANHAKVKIICKDHGVFEQRPNGHISATAGCSSCSDHGFKLDREGAFYIIKTDNFIGFGITNNLEKRMRIHGRLLKRNKINYFLSNVFYGAGFNISCLEQHVKQKFKPDIINTGIDGFKTEALPLSRLDHLLELCNNTIDNT